MKGIIPVLVFVVVGLVCVVLTEILGVTLLLALPPSVEAVGNIIWFVYTPVIITLAVVSGLLLTGFLRRASMGTAFVYPAVFAIGQFALLTVAQNPMGYKLTLLTVTSTVTVLAVLWRRRGKRGVKKKRRKEKGLVNDQPF